MTQATAFALNVVIVVMMCLLCALLASVAGIAVGCFLEGLAWGRRASRILFTRGRK